MVCLGSEPWGAVLVVAMKTEGARAWFVAESLGVVVMFKFVIIFELSG